MQNLSPAQLLIANLAVETLRVILTSNLSSFQKTSLEKVLDTLRKLSANPTPGELNAEEHMDASQGKKISAIKSVRDRTGLGLKEAKDLVEKFYPPRPWTPPPASLSNLSRVEHNTTRRYDSDDCACGDPECCPNG